MPIIIFRDIMIHVNSRTWIVVIVAGLLVFACYLTLSGLSFSAGSQDHAKIVQQPSENSSSPVTIRVETDKSVYDLGEIVRLKVFIVNRGPDTLEIGPVDYGYTVFDSEGNCLIRLISSGLHPYGTAFTVAPSSDVLLTDLLGWGQQFVRREGDTLIKGTVSPGTYTIRVETRGDIQAAAEVSITIG